MKNKWIYFILALSLITGGVAYFSLWLPKNNQTYEGTELSGEATDFQLTDQNGDTVSLSDFQGKVVVLTFIDSKCTDTCPITAVHFREVYKQLEKREADQVVFLGVNVNVEASTVKDVMETTQAWHLDEIPEWHFLTGSHEELEPIWKEFGVSAIHSHDTSSIMHTPGTFLIDRSGHQRWYVSTLMPGEGDVDLSLPLSQLLLKHIHELLSENNIS
jgi:cytochrome oxidase Cu insertion factor (SCO1/SenC/PrrC family)